MIPLNKSRSGTSSRQGTSFSSSLLLRSFIADFFLMKPDKRRELNLKRCGDKRSVWAALASPRLFFTLVLEFFQFYILALIFKHECHHPKTQEKEKERSLPCSAVPINSMKASRRAIDLRDQCTNPLVLPVLEETRRRKREAEAGR